MKVKERLFTGRMKRTHERGAKVTAIEGGKNIEAHLEQRKRKCNPHKKNEIEKKNAIKEEKILKLTLNREKKRWPTDMKKRKNEIEK